ncbi:hypothetical protein QQ9_2357 [Clostridioides difficile Y312]|nr:hypothetical protein [Clostridioides difficile]EQF68610.1 hypothetical protein QGG_2285 [Clostridioides difficile CD201]EQH47051.1 hypothetical protein QME_2488 [Clostridioides difficile DA00246]EQI05480.1 hypothetical protein QOG_2308 [Clostridioides difficile Y10]EQI17363.1 hypothetical protein QOK_2531 [Clostridioides difficile Y41]EQI21257.1 hypothetical protein QOM_2239 [Clostridioides difficile Y155]EQI57509.1 hypothetical protein QQ9_2357 [Clostridioides difficile Y312]
MECKYYMGKNFDDFYDSFRLTIWNVNCIELRIFLILIIVLD